MSHMSIFTSILKRDLLLAWRQGGTMTSAALFLLAMTALVPLALGPSLLQPARLAPALLWIGALLSSLLTLDRLFLADEEDGSLDLLAASASSLEIVALAKIVAHWLSSSAPVVLLSPVYALMLGAPAAALPDLMLSLAIGTPAFTALGAVGAALTLNLKRGSLLLPLLVMPLAMPLLIFGTYAAQPLAVSGLEQKPFLVLAGLSLLSLALAPLGAAAALKAGRG